MNHLVVLTRVVHLEHELWQYMEGNTYKYILSIANCYVMLSYSAI